ncbi:MAG: hypothetical protein PHY44_01610 [Lachnospiraceae bacterium]|nr:hypothetical protein [Lachnospiraceae bacterium]
MGSILDKEDFKNALLYKWKINDTAVNTIIENFPNKCELYGYNHYVLLQSAIKMHLTNLSKDKQIAYINCKKLDYSFLDNVSALDFLIGIIVGCSVSLVWCDSIAILALVPSLLILCGLKLYSAINRKYKFHLQLLDSLVLEE